MISFCVNILFDFLLLRVWFFLILVCFFVKGIGFIFTGRVFFVLSRSRVWSLKLWVMGVVLVWMGGLEEMVLESVV